MRLVVDYRERLLLPLLADVGKVEVRPLPVGDLLLAGKEAAVLIERKAVEDFLSSLGDGRLWSQVERLAAAGASDGHRIDCRLLLVHGDFRECVGRLLVEGRIGTSRTLWRVVMGASAEVLLRHGVPVVSAPTNAALVEFLRAVSERLDGAAPGAGRIGFACLGHRRAIHDSFPC